MDLPQDGGRLLVVGAGKPVAAMAEGLEATLGDRIHGGLLITKYGHGRPLTHIALREAGHPLPDAAGVAATRDVLAYLHDTTRRDKVLVLLGGGASALLVAPCTGLSLADKIATTDLLLRSRAEIAEINTIRRHLSQVKGGGLLKAIEPADSVTLIISDVPDDDLAAIGSGPTVTSDTSYDSCLEILAKYNLTERVPDAALATLAGQYSSPASPPTLSG